MKAIIKKRLAAILALATVLTSVPVAPVQAYISDTDIADGYISDEVFSYADTSEGYLSDENVSKMSSSEEVYAEDFYEEALAPETAGNIVDPTTNSYITWFIDGNGCLFVTGDKKGFRDNDGLIPWASYKNVIKSAKVTLTGAVTELSGMFEDCVSLNEVNFERINVTDLKDIHNMFKGCTSLTGIKNISRLSPNAGSGITDMSSLFENCSSLTDLDLTGFDTENVKDMSRMFYGCSKLESLDVTGFDAIKVINMNEMFAGCSKITELDLSSFNIGNVDALSANDVLKDCQALNIVRAPHNPTKTGKTQYAKIVLPDNGGWVWRNKDKNISVTALTYDIPRGALVTIGGDPTPESNVLDQGKINDTVFWVLYKTGKLTVSGNGEIHDKDGNIPWLAYTAEILSAEIDLSGTKDLSGMFEGCYNLSILSSNDLSGLDTSAAEDMSYMFKDCSLLSGIDLSHFNTSKVIKMKGMFENCSSLTALDLSAFNTLTVKDMTDMFKGCSNITSMDLSSFDMRNINIPGGSAGMFEGCTSLATVISPGYPSVDIGLPGGVWLNNNTNRRSKVIPANIQGGVTYTKTTDIECGDYMNSWWWIDVNKKLYVMGTGDIHDMDDVSPWSVYSESVNTAEISLTGATNLSRMFEGCDKLTSINWNGFSTDTCTNMSAMFRNCKSLTNINLSVFNTSNVTEMGYMFEGCSGLTGIDVSNFDTSKVYDVRGMFRDCTSLTQLDLSNLDMIEVKSDYYMGLMLENSTGLTSCKAPKNLRVPITLPVIDGKGWKENNGTYGQRVLAIPKTALAGTEYVTALNITSITLQEISSNSIQPSYDLNPNASMSVKATVLPPEADPKDIIWTSSNTGVATVSADFTKAVGNTIEAVITAGIKPGSSIITAAFGNVKADPLVIRVLGALRLNPNNLNLLSGHSDAITVDLTDPQYNVASLILETDVPNMITHSISGNTIVITASTGITEETTVTLKAITPDREYEDVCLITIFPDPNEKIEDWGDLDDPNIRDLFNNDPENVPKGLWYLMPDNGNNVSGNTVYKVYEEAAVLNFSRTYTGSEILLDDEIGVYYGVRKLWGRRDYNVVYKNNKDAAPATIKKAPSLTISGTGSFQNSAEFKFTIEPEDINNADLMSEGHVAIDNKTKIGTITPLIRYKGTKLVINRDYELTYYAGTPDTGMTMISNPKKWAAQTGDVYSIVVSGKDGSNFTGSMKPITLTTIDPKDSKYVKMSKVRVRTYPIEWDENPISLNELFDNTVSDNDCFKVEYNKKELKFGSDFKIAEEDESMVLTDAGRYTFRLRGTANSTTSENCYVGDKVVTVEITGTPASKVKIAALKNSVYYTGEQITMEDLYEDDGSYDKVTLYVVRSGVQVPLIEGTDYDYEMANSGSIGKFKLTFTLKGGYTGVITKTIRVFQYNIHTDVYHKLDVYVEPEAVFSKGGAIPKVTIMFGSRKLDEDIDYTLSFKNNVRIGSYTDGYSAPTVTISGIGNFSGKITETFSIKKAPMENIKLILDDKEYKEKMAKGYFKASPRLEDGGRILSMGKGKDVEAVAKTAYKYYYAGSGGQEIDINETRIPPNTLIEVRVTITCSDESPYIAGTKELKGYYRLIEKTKDLRNSTVYLEDPKAMICCDSEAEIRELLKQNLNVSIKKVGLTEERDYKITSVKNFRSPGTATIELEGVGQYGSKKTFTFKIYRRKQ